jgi:hypothetical protein
MADTEVVARHGVTVGAAALQRAQRAV